MHSLDHADPNGTFDPVTEQAIRERAYEIYEQRGREDGRAEEDWLQAEAELFSHLHAPVAA